MQCPHCQVSFHDSPTRTYIGEDKTGSWIAIHRICPACERLHITLATGHALRNQFGNFINLSKTEHSFMVYPKAPQRPLPPDETPAHIREDFIEACLVLPDSAKAAAALSRRCLQSVLRDSANVNAGTLSNEIQQLLDSNTLPTYLAESIDAIRNIGNFAAHPQKSNDSGTIMPVEPGEVEWMLNVLESLFDFFYVQPSVLKAKRDALNAKLAEAGKPPMK